MLLAQPNPAAVMFADLITGVYDYLNLVLPIHATGVYLGVVRLRMDGATLLDVVGGDRRSGAP